MTTAISRQYDSGLIRFILLLTVPLLFLPKINLLKIGGETAGLRIDDLFIFAAFCCILLGIILSKRPLQTIERYLIAVVLTSLLSFFINYILYLAGYLITAGNLLYAIRMIEYFTFFYTGTFLIQFFNFSRLIQWFIAVNAVIMVLQWFGVIGAFSHVGYIANTAHHSLGITAGHWEMGFILNLLYAVMLFSSHSRRFVHQYLVVFQIRRHSISINCTKIALFALFSLLILMTGSRSSLATFFLITLARLLLIPYWRIIVLGALLTTIIVATTYLANTSVEQLPDSPMFAVLHRSQKLLQIENFTLVKQLLHTIDISQTTLTDNYIDLSLDPDLPVDLSLYIRLHKWAYVVLYLAAKPLCIFFGLGPGFCGPALDGGLLRLFAENGLIGGSLFFLFIYQGCKHSRALKAAFAVFLLNMVFIDIYLAYKAMSLFFILIGAMTAQQHQKSVIPAKNRT
ncbi:hypothetical protein JYU14_05255 [Simkania negevensis]|uniref:O-antigen polymerase n=1 Tax=Simkania negevensis TaxID=83561 RepID=A0ABS3ARW2_9BACT|nr:hypothetical protein [Simkania negevensis]